MGKDTVNVFIRMPKDLKDELTMLAKRDLRSLNSEVIFLLDAAVHEFHDSQQAMYDDLKHDNPDA